jgi:DNA-binding winged helix-turn-helix (wHTH) protein/predicted ATPase
VPLDPAVRFGPYVLDPTQGLRRGRSEVRLTPKALAVLRVLASRAGQVVTKDDLFRLAWPDTAVGDAALASCIQELRRKLKDDARRPRYIETVHRRGYRFLEQGSFASVPERPRPSARTTFGRERELSRLHGALDRARSGTRQAVFICGEAGIGKTTLVQALLSNVSRERVLWGQCVEHYGPSEAYQPILEALTRAGLAGDGAVFVTALARYAPTWLAQLPALVGAAQLASLRRRTAGAMPERMQRELTDAIEALAREAPLVVLLEDLHWRDPATLDWIAAFARRPEPAAVLLIATYRPGERAHVVAEVAETLRFRRAADQIALDRLGPEAVDALVAARHPPTVAAEPALHRLAQAIHRHTEGNPLFVDAVLDDLVVRGLLVARGERWEVDPRAEEPLEISDDVRRLIERQLDRLTDEGRLITDVAAVAGLEFAAASVAAGAGLGVADAESLLLDLERRTQLVRRVGTAEWPDGTACARFAFAHALHREVALRRLPPARAAALHRAVGLREEAGMGPRAGEIAAELARHFEQGREWLRAAAYSRLAAAEAARRGAYDAALNHVRSALATIDAAVPASPARDEEEAALHIARGGLLMASGGWAAAGVAEAYERARALYERLGKPGPRFAAVWGEWLYRWGRAELTQARELSDGLLGLAEGRGDPDLLLQAHHAQWATAFSRGDLASVDLHATRGIVLYDPERHAAMAQTFGSHDAGVCARSFRGCALALLGRGEEAAAVSEGAVDLARRLEHPFSVGLALFFAALAAQLRRDPAAARAQAAAARAIAREQGLRLLLAWSATVEGWAMAVSGDARAGFDLMHEGLDGAQSTGSRQFRPHMLGLLVEGHLAAGARADGLEVANDALALAEGTGEMVYAAELRRLRAELESLPLAPTRSGTGARPDRPPQ